MVMQQGYNTPATIKLAAQLMFSANDGNPRIAEGKAAYSPGGEDTQDLQWEYKNSESDMARSLTGCEALMLAASSVAAEHASMLEKIAKMQQMINENAEKVKFYDDLTDTTELYNCGVTAKTLGMGKFKFMHLLREIKVLMPSGNKKNLPYQKHIDSGFLDVKWINPLDRSTGERKPTPVPLFTGKGLIWIKGVIEKRRQAA